MYEYERKVKQTHPELYEKLKQRETENRAYIDWYGFAKQEEIRLQQQSRNEDTFWFKINKFCRKWIG